MRPHRAPARRGRDLRYWVRPGAETVDAERSPDLLRGLIEQTARVPWDDRRALHADVDDLREVKVREYLRDIDSGLRNESREREVYRRLRVTTKVNDHEAPRNVGLPARNRRIGEFLKELGVAEGRLSGLPKVFRAMEANGSPTPQFEFDERRTVFQATLPAHPEYAALSALRDAAHLRALGEAEEALRRVETAWETHRTSATLAAEMIKRYAERGETGRAEEVLEAFEAQGPRGAAAHVANTLVEALVKVGDADRARRLLKRNHLVMAGRDAIDAAVLARRARDSRTAHRYFEQAGDTVHSDPRALLEFAQTKIWLAAEAHRRGQRGSNRRFLTEARTLLERVVQMDGSPARHAWAWRELGRTLRWLGMPVGEVERAYERAVALLPDEPRFVRELKALRGGRGG